MPFYKIPMIPGAPQEFSVRLAGVSYRLRALYRNAPQGGWYLDILSGGSEPILLGAPLVPGLDILMQYRHLNIEGELYIFTDGDLLADPTFASLGATTFLYFWSEQ